jgi:hypothetical protein
MREGESPYSKTSSDGTHDTRHKLFQISVVGCAQLESLETSSKFPSTNSTRSFDNNTKASRLQDQQPLKQQHLKTKTKRIAL